MCFVVIHHFSCLTVSETYFLVLTTALLILRFRTVRLSIAAPHQVDTRITAPELVGQTTWRERKQGYKLVIQLCCHNSNCIKPPLRISANFTSWNQICSQILSSNGKYGEWSKLINLISHIIGQPENMPASLDVIWMSNYVPWFHNQECGAITVNIGLQ